MDLKEAFEEDGSSLHMAQPDNFGGFTEAAPAWRCFYPGAPGTKIKHVLIFSWQSRMAR